MAGAAVVGASGLISACALRTGGSTGPAAAPRGTYLRKGGSIGTGDPVLGTLPRGDVHAQGEVDEPVQRLSGPAPVYPAALRAAGREGMVQIRMVVDTLGRVEAGSVQIVHSTNVGFEGAALDAVRRARFAPARGAGQAVRQLVQQSVRFAIES